MNDTSTAFFRHHAPQPAYLRLPASDFYILMIKSEYCDYFRLQIKYYVNTFSKCVTRIY